VASFVEFALYKSEGLGAICESLSFHLVYWQCVTEEVVKAECSPVDQRVRLYRWIFFKLHDLGAGQSRRLVSPRGGIRRTIVGQFRPFVAHQGLVLVAGKDTCWHRLSAKCRLCKRIGRLVEAPWDVIEFEAIEFFL